MRKLCLGLSVVAIVMLAACDDETTNVTETTGLSVIAKGDKIPSCSADIEGKMIYVADSAETFFCADGKWQSLKGEKGESGEQGEGNQGPKGESGDSSSSSFEDAGSSESGDLTSSSSEDVGSSESEESSSSSEEDSSGSISPASSSGSIYDAAANTLTDLRDGQVYRTTTIEINDAEHGIDYSEVWMAENLNFVTASSWCGGGSETTEGDCSVYGRLYSWKAAIAVCPEGWHLPSVEEWVALITAVGGSSVAGTMLKSKTGWESYPGVENNDTYLFSVLPAGYRSGDGFFYFGYADFWSSTEYNGNYAYYMDMADENNGASLGHYNKYFDYSVRCLKD